MRGVGNGDPIAGACECLNSMDESTDGYCVPAVTSTNYSLAAVLLLIINCLLITFTTCTKGMRFFLYRMIEDFQEISLVVFINLQFPQQLHTFLAKLYWFNFTSIAKLFESMAQSTLFVFSNKDVLLATYQTSQNKFRSMMKTTNFLSNSFNIFLLFGGCIGLLFVIRDIRNCFAKDPESLKYRWVNKLFNMSWLGLFIHAFYMSLIEFSLNTAIQVSNLNISTTFSIFGLMFCGIMVAFVVLVLGYFLKQHKEQSLLKEKYRDQSYSTFWHLSNDRKFIGKYYWFWVAGKKILLPFLYVCLQDKPHTLITAVGITQALWLVLAVYSEPYERKYLRLSLYASETFKLLVYVALSNFSEKYVNYLPLVPITNMVYLLIVLTFASHTLFILCNIIIEA